MAEYCRSLVEELDDAAHTGFDTLNRILREGMIRGSSRMIRGTTPVVSLTECLPHNLSHLIKWRTGLARWTFEPYGIALDGELLLKLGADRVIYGDDRVYESLPPEERYRFQLADPARNNWSEEREWLLKGNLDLREVRSEDIVILVRTVEEAATVQDRFGLTALPGTE